MTTVDEIRQWNKTMPGGEVEQVLLARIAELEAALRRVVDTSHGAGRSHWEACARARAVLLKPTA